MVNTSRFPLITQYAWVQLICEVKDSMYLVLDTCGPFTILGKL